MQIVQAPHLPVRDDWLALREEAVLQPDLPIVDAHHHLWDRQSGRYLADELRRDIDGTGDRHGGDHRIVSTVYVQCRSMLRANGPEALKPVGEAEFANGVAAMFASGAYGSARACEAIVGGADLSLGTEVAAVIEAMLAATGGRLRGMRNPLAWHESEAVRSSPVVPPRDRMEHESFRAGVRTLARYGLVLDAWVYHTQLDTLYALAASTPDVTVVIDHFGGPVGVGPHAGQSAQTRAAWIASLRRLASLPNTRIKLGGAGMSVFGFDFATHARPPSSEALARAWSPLVETCVELFGAQRCMFESNFPVDKGMTGYTVLWNAFKRIASGVSPDERAALFSRTAATTYGLDLPGDNT